MSTTALIATAIIAVLAATAVLGWVMWRLVRSAKRMERDPKYLRRLIWAAMIYVFGVLFGTIESSVGNNQYRRLLGCRLLFS